MKQQENGQKLSNLNISLQSSQKQINPHFLLTDYNIFNIADDINNQYKTIKIEKVNRDKRRYKIMVNSNASKNHHNMPSKKILQNYIAKTPGIFRSNNSKEKTTEIKYNKMAKKMIPNERKLNISQNSRLLPYSTNNKKRKDFKIKLKKNKKGESKDINSIKNKNDIVNRNLNLTLTNFSSLGGTEFKKDSINKSPEPHDLSIGNHLNGEIIIKRKYANLNKSNIYRKILNGMNLNDFNNYNNSITSTNNTLSNKISTNTSIQLHKKKHHQKINLLSSSTKLNVNSPKKIHNISIDKKFDILKNNMNDQINDINHNYKKIRNISDIDNIKKNELIIDIIQNSFFKFISLLKDQKEKEAALEIIKKLDEFMKKKDNIVNKIIKKNNDLNEKIKDYKEMQKSYQKENMQLIDKIEILQKKIEEMEEEIKNNELKLKESKINLLENGYQDEIKIYDKENGDNYDKSEEESSVNSEELESIRFFDKIIMKKHSFSKANIPELEIKQIKLNSEIENKELPKINYNKIKNNKIFRNGNFNKFKDTHNGLWKKENKSSKVIGYKKVVDNKNKKIKK